MHLEELKEIGFNEKESKIYLELLQSGETLVSTLAENTKINRSLLYSILTGLCAKGLVTYIIKNNIRYYKASEPEKILSMIREKEAKFMKILPSLRTIIPKTTKPTIEILEGKEGIKTILNDILRNKKNWLAFNIPGKGPEVLGPGVHAFQKERQKAKIKLSVICLRTQQGIKRGKEFAQMDFTEVRYLPESYGSPASNWIYANRIVIVFWYKHPFAIRIIDKKLAESYKEQFQVLWTASRNSSIT